MICFFYSFSQSHEEAILWVKSTNFIWLKIIVKMFQFLSSIGQGKNNAFYFVLIILGKQNNTKYTGVSVSVPKPGPLHDSLSELSLWISYSTLLSVVRTPVLIFSHTAESPEFHMFIIFKVAKKFVELQYHYLISIKIANKETLYNLCSDLPSRSMREKLIVRLFRQLTFFYPK